MALLRERPYLVPSRAFHTQTYTVALYSRIHTRQQFPVKIFNSIHTPEPIAIQYKTLGSEGGVKTLNALWGTGTSGGGLLSRERKSRVHVCVIY